jgi:molybdopterin-containing oxidoreductase family iron-sulfur binding subunit
MSRRTPYHLEDAPAAAPRVWRSLEDKDRTAAERTRRAEAEHPGGFVKADVSAASLRRSGGDQTASGGGFVEATSLNRRTFLTAAGVSAAALGVQGCIRRPEENILPYAEAPEHVVPGVPMHFATVTERRGDALGLLVTSHENRPTKIEGNPEHPATLGKSDAYAQASVLDLYDPHRSRAPAKREGGQLVDVKPGEADRALRDLAAKHAEDGGRGLRILSAPSNSPTFLRLRAAVQARLPQARFHTFSSVSDDNARAGARAAFGRPLSTLYRLDQAEVILALDSDFLVTEPGALRNARGFAAKRAPTTPSDAMSRLYAVEGTFSVTGSNADHRLRLPSGNIGRYFAALAKELVSAHGVDLGDAGAAVAAAEAPKVGSEWITQLAADLAGARGRAPVLVGSRQPAWVHALAHAVNQGLGNVGTTVVHHEVTDPDADAEGTDLASLVDAMKGGQVSTLVMLGGNPVYEAPSDLGFPDALARDGLTSIHLSPYRDETSVASSWHLPRTHELEAWGDQRALDGTRAVQQPLIAPLYDGARSDIEVLAVWAGERNTRGHQLVRRTLRPTLGEMGFERSWRKVLHHGVVEGSTQQPAAPALDPAGVAAAVRPRVSDKVQVGPDALELVFAADYHTFDGRHANNPWMLEMPHPMTRVAWDNTAQISPKTAKKLGVETADILKVSREGAKDVEIAVTVLPGQADWVLTLPLGWGRNEGIKYGKGAGYDVHPLRTASAFHFAGGARAKAAGRRNELMAQLQEHHDMEGRPIAVDATLQTVHTSASGYADAPSYQELPTFAEHASVVAATQPLWDQVDYSKVHKWGMVIDLSSCTGCHACVIACQSENNIPAVGKQQSSIGRAMHWIRIDRYFVGDDEDEPLVAVQPVACQHCEEAPCENVCPVNATAHSPEGLNDMAYNRCIGTRYCMNNCPYKVRRFNYLNWNGHLDKVVNDLGGMYGDMPETHQMQKNPDVTVRYRGVMEKCTYCTQRIQKARIHAKNEDRDIRPGEVVTACQQACPSNAISFGDLNEPEFYKLASMNRRYSLLAPIGTQPRTTYLGKIRNPNPAMLPAKAAPDSAQAAAAPAEAEG